MTRAPTRAQTHTFRALYEQRGKPKPLRRGVSILTYQKQGPHEHFCPLCGLVGLCVGRLVLQNYHPLGCENGPRVLQCLECHADLLDALARDRLQRLRPDAP